jgi:hypothetical protein
LSPMAIGGGCRRGITRFFFDGSLGGLTEPSCCIHSRSDTRLLGPTACRSYELAAAGGARSTITRNCKTRAREVAREFHCEWHSFFYALRVPYLGHDPHPPPRLAAARCALFLGRSCDMHGVLAMTGSGLLTRSRHAHVCNHRGAQESTRLQNMFVNKLNTYQCNYMLIHDLTRL